MTEQRRSGFMTLAQLGRRLAQRILPGTAMGYDSGEPNARTVQGDENFPFFKDPADLAEARAYFAVKEGGQSIPVAAEYADMLELDPIDVRGYRTLTLFVDYLSVDAGDDPTIGLVPQAAVVFEGSGQKIWTNYGVVDPTLRGTGFVPTSTETSLEARSTAYRDVYSSQLDLSFRGTRPRAVMLFFDVAPVAEVRFLIGSVARTEDDTALEDIHAALYYQLGR